MPSLIDIRRRIRSVKNTQQITKAMKMVSAAVAGDESVPENPLLARRDEKRILLVLITADKGLAGAFNTNLIKGAQRFQAERPGVEVKFELIGRKGRDFFRKRAVLVSGEYLGLAAKGRHEDTAPIAQKAMEMFRAEEIDAVYLIFNEFKSVATQAMT